MRWSRGSGGSAAQCMVERIDEKGGSKLKQTNEQVEQTLVESWSSRVLETQVRVMTMLEQESPRKDRLDCRSSVRKGAL